jgi:hypothetical protein
MMDKTLKGALERDYLYQRLAGQLDAALERFDWDDARVIEVEMLDRREWLCNSLDDWRDNSRGWCDA